MTMDSILSNPIINAGANQLVQDLKQIAMAVGPRGTSWAI